MNTIIILTAVYIASWIVIAISKYSEKARKKFRIFRVININIKRALSAMLIILFVFVLLTFFIFINCEDHIFIKKISINPPNIEIINNNRLERVVVAYSELDNGIVNIVSDDADEYMSVYVDDWNPFMNKIKLYLHSSTYEDIKEKYDSMKSIEIAGLNEHYENQIRRIGE